MFQAITTQVYAYRLMITLYIVFKLTFSYKKKLIILKSFHTYIFFLYCYTDKISLVITTKSILNSRSEFLIMDLEMNEIDGKR